MERVERRYALAMPGDVLMKLVDQAERSGPEVRAAALLRIARVASATDRVAALRMFDAALEASKRQQQAKGSPGHAAEFVAGQARQIAAAISPERAAAMPGGDAGSRMALHFGEDQLVRVMIDHGHTDEAIITYMLGRADGTEFPFGSAGMLLAKMASAGGTTRGELLMRRAAAAWRRVVAAPSNGGPFWGQGFVALFVSNWQLLPQAEAKAIVGEIAAQAQGQIRVPMTATYDQAGTVRINNLGEHMLFEVLPVLRQVDPELTAKLLGEYGEFAAAARRFPNGMESAREEMEARAKEGQQQQAPGGGGGGFGMAGDPRDFPYLKSLIEAERGTADFEGPFGYALERYQQDALGVSRNRAPKEFWSSTHAFRDVLYRAARRLGRDGAGAYLSRIPDADLRLFAAIELEAALAGLPEFREATIEQRQPPGR